MYKIIESFNQYVYTEKINLNSINKDTNYNLKYIQEILSEWQNPKDSKYILNIIY
jgi:hypothetical protein